MPIPNKNALITYREIVLSEISQDKDRKPIATFRKRPTPPAINLPLHQGGRLFRRINAIELAEWRGAIRSAWGAEAVNECGDS